MAKNKNNRDRKQPQSERARQQASETAAAPRDEQLAPPVPGDTAVRGKRQKRFGHN